MQIRGRRGESIEPTIGVKQGCPLSPTLFGLLMDGLHFDLKAKYSLAGADLNAGVGYVGQNILDLCYADDCFLAARPIQLYLILGFVFDWLASAGMQISAEKTGIITFGGPSIPGEVWRVRGKDLKQITSYKYLGLELTAADGVAGTFPQLHKRMLGSYHALWHKFGNLHCGISQQMQLQLFVGSVPQAASFGCELWGPMRLGKTLAQQRTQLAQGYLQLARRLCRVCCSVCEGCSFKLGIRLLEVLWWRQVIHFWNGLIDPPQRSMNKAVVKSEVLDATRHKVRNWVYGVHAGLNRLGHVFQLDASTPQRIELARVLELLAVRANDKWRDLDVCPRTCPSKGASLDKNLRWFAPPNQVRPRTYLALRLGVVKSRTVLSCRMGAAKISINDHSRARQDRTCRRCGLGALGDKRHLLL